MSESSIHPLSPVPPAPHGASERLLRAFRLHDMIHRLVDPPTHLEVELTGIWENLTPEEKVEYAALGRCPILDNVAALRAHLGT